MAFRLQAAPVATCRPRSTSPLARQHIPESSHDAPDWSRMRTPSPERSYVGYALLAPQVLLAPVFVPYSFMPEPMMNQQPQPIYPCNVAMCAPEAGMKESNVLDTLSKDFTHRNLRMKMDDTLSEADTDACSEDSSLGSEHSSIDDMDLPDDIPSIGSLNHPHSCGQPCKYIKKARGCKDGLNCSHCHICTWQSRRHGKCKQKNPKCVPSVGKLTLSPCC